MTPHQSVVRTPISLTNTESDELKCMTLTYVSVDVACLGENNLCKTFAAPDAAQLAAELHRCCLSLGSVILK